MHSHALAQGGYLESAPMHNKTGYHPELHQFQPARLMRCIVLQELACMMCVCVCGSIATCSLASGLPCPRSWPHAMMKKLAI